jgi:hypothetical protein
MKNKKEMLRKNVQIRRPKGAAPKSVCFSFLHGIPPFVLVVPGIGQYRELYTFMMVFTAAKRLRPTTALREIFSPEEIRNSGTLHTTNKAFDRYLQIKADDAKKIYEATKNLKRIKGCKNNLKNNKNIEWF